MEGEWRTSSFSEGSSNCVQVRAGQVRDSKDPDGAVLRVDLAGLVNAAKEGTLDS